MRILLIISRKKSPTQEKISHAHSNKEKVQNYGTLIVEIWSMTEPTTPPEQQETL